MNRSSSRRLRAWVVLVVLAGSAVRLYHVGAQAAWIDELYRVLWAKGYEPSRVFGFLPGETGARLPPRDLDSALAVANRHNPPLNTIVLHAWIQATGSDSDLSARLPSVIFGALSILGVYLAGRQLLGPRVGAWAATLVALSPFHVFYAREINHYALAACLVALSYWCYFGWWQRRSIAWGAGLAATGLAALYTHYYVGIVLLLQAVALLVAFARGSCGRRDPRTLLVTFGPYLAMAAGFAPYLATLRAQLPEMTSQAQLGAFRGLPFFASQMLTMGALPFAGDFAETLSPLVGGALAALGLVLVIAGVRAQRDRDSRAMLLLNTLGPVAVVAALYWLMRTNSILWPRYQLVFTVPQLLAMAAALETMRRWRPPALALLAVSAALGLWATFSLVKEDWRGAAAAIASHGGDENVIVYRQNLTYSLARYLSSGNRLFGVEPTPDLAHRIAVATEGSAAAWLVTAWPGARDPFPGALDHLLACRYARRQRLPIDPGRVALTATRYSEPRTAPDPTCDAPPAMPPRRAPWERAASGPVLELATIDAPSVSVPVPAAASLTVSGWAFSTAGVRSLAFELDGVEVGRTRHLGLFRQDVAGAFPEVPRTHAEHAGFWAVLGASGVGPGRHALSLLVEHEDGTRATLARGTFTVLPSPSRQLAAAPR